MFVGLFCCIYCCFLTNKYFSCEEQILHVWSICCLEPNSVLLSYHPAHKGTPPSRRRGIYTKQKALKFETSRLLRYGRDSNPRPPAWQAGILTSWTTTPFGLLTCDCGAKVAISLESAIAAHHFFLTFYWWKSLVVHFEQIAANYPDGVAWFCA